jgi:hypothetical protein
MLFRFFLFSISDGVFLFDKMDSNENLGDKKSLSEDLFTFAILYNIPRTALKYLLNILVKHGIDVPSTPYKLKQTHSSFDVTSYDIQQNSMAYIGVRDNITFAVESGHLPLDDTNLCPMTSFLDLKFNIDGLPIFKSSQYNLWPILMQINNIPSPYPVGLHCGIGKPVLKTMTDKLVAEIKELKTNGFHVRHHLICLRSVVFICDAPARSFLQCIKGHSGYFGCGYCRQKGDYADDRVIFPDFNSALRTDEEYMLFKENNQTSPSPFLSVVPLFHSFPPEYMHLLCLGVMRKLCHYYFCTTKGSRLPCRLSASQLSVVSQRIRNMREYIPREFQRKIRPLHELEHYKASEYRFFLLYAGIFLLKDILPVTYTKHLALLHFSCYVFASERFSHLHTHASRCIEIFVKQMPQLFGRKSLIYNVHVLLHLPFL